MFPLNGDSQLKVIFLGVTIGTTGTSEKLLVCHGVKD